MHRLYVRSSYPSDVFLYHLQLALVTQAVMLDLNSVASLILMMLTFFSLLRLFALCAHCLCCIEPCGVIVYYTCWYGARLLIDVGCVCQCMKLVCNE